MADESTKTEWQAADEESKARRAAEKEAKAQEEKAAVAAQNEKRAAAVAEAEAEANEDLPAGARVEGDVLTLGDGIIRLEGRPGGAQLVIAGSLDPFLTPAEMTAVSDWLADWVDEIPRRARRAQAAEAKAAKATEKAEKEAAAAR